MFAFPSPCMLEFVVVNMWSTVSPHKIKVSLFVEFGVDVKITGSSDTSACAFARIVQSLHFLSRLSVSCSQRQSRRYHGISRSSHSLHRLVPQKKTKKNKKNKNAIFPSHGVVGHSLRANEHHLESSRVESNLVYSSIVESNLVESSQMSIIFRLV